MELVIRVDLDKTKQSLPEIFRLIGDCRSTDEAHEEIRAGAVGVIQDSRSRVIGEWDIEETETALRPLESSYRAAAMSRYARPGEIEIDRFATVSPADDGAYVQCWLHVPQADVASAAPEALVSRKPPVSAFPIRNAEKKAG